MSNVDAKEAIAQGVYQILGDVHRLASEIRNVTEYCSLFTNDLNWIHLRRIERLDGEVWVHSDPISVVQ